MEVVKFSQEMLVYIHGTREGTGQSVLVVNRDWGKKNQDEVRKFFMRFAHTDIGEKLTSLKQALGDINGAALWLDMRSVYIVSNGDLFYKGKLWLIRGSKVQLVLSIEQDRREVSGWVKQGDLLVLLGAEADCEIVERKLLSAVGQLNEEVPKVEGVRFLSSMNLGGFGVGFWMKATDKVDLIPEPARLIEKPVSVKSPFVFSNRFGRVVGVFNTIRRLIDECISFLLSKVKLAGELMVGTIEKIVNTFPSTEKIYAVEMAQLRDQARSRHKRFLLLISIGLLISLTVSIGWGLKERRQIEWEQKFGEILIDLKYKLEEGRKIAAMNPDRARELVSQAGTMIQTLETRGLSEEEVADLRGQVGVVMGLASGKQQAEISTWLSLGLVREGMVGVEMRRFRDDLVLLDEEGRIVRISMNDKSANVLASREQVGDMEEVAIYDKSIAVLSDRGLIELKNDEVNKLFDRDDEWGRVFDLKMFAGNIYVGSETGIWRYPVIEIGFGDMQRWLDEEVESIANGAVLEIDGFVWLAESGGNIRKFARGVEDSFVIKELEESFSDIESLYADEEGLYLYVLEPGKNRIVSLDKETGKYKQQYVSEDFARGKSLVVNEEEGWMLVLAGDRILEIKL